MYLRHLEDYIVKLGMLRVEQREGAMIAVDDVMGDLMEILIEEESLIPDMCVDGDSRYHEFSDVGFVDFEDSEFDDFFGESSDVYADDFKQQEKILMRLMFLLACGVVVGLIGYLIGFFTAPQWRP